MRAVAFVSIAIAGFALLPGARATSLGDEAPQGASAITLELTVSIDPAVLPPGYDHCGTQTAIAAFTGQVARWCYRVTNTGSVPLTRHDLASSGFGTVLSNLSFPLAAGASAFVTQHAEVTASRTETATWTAFNPGPVDVAHSQASASLVASSGLALEVTLGLDPLGPPPADYCGTSTLLVARPGRTVRWCYRIHNLSTIAVSRHQLESGSFGVLLNNFQFTLQPGTSAFLTKTQVVGESDVVETATWTGYNPGPVNVSNASGGAGLVVDIAIFSNGFEQP